MKGVKKQSINKRLSIILISCSMLAIILSAFFVNFAISRNFSNYMLDIQNKRNDKIIQSLQNQYKEAKSWSQDSGAILMHEAYMGSYFLTLYDRKGTVVWGMNPKDMTNLNQMHMTYDSSQKGNYSSKDFNIVVDNTVVGKITIGQYSGLLLSQDDVNFKKSINYAIALSSFIVAIIAICLGLYFSIQFSTPIERASNTSMELSKGNYTARSNEKSNIKELSNLLNSINILGEKLAHQDLLRKRLVSDISHEIRTPLNVLQNNLEAMLDGVLPINHERLNNLNNEIIRFGKLLNNLDALKKIDYDTNALNLENINMVSLISTICKEYEALALEQNISLKLKASKTKLKLQGDPEKLKQVFINLISNALKFNKPNGFINIDISNSKAGIKVTVEDNGMGISKDDLPHIFERLYRGDKSRHQIDGTGVGLTIVKKLLDLHNATIEVESELGIGTKFTILFTSKE